MGEKYISDVELVLKKTKHFEILKRVLIVLACLLLLVPTILSIKLTLKVKKLENELDEYKSSKSEVIESMSDKTEDKLLQDDDNKETTGTEDSKTPDKEDVNESVGKTEQGTEDNQKKVHKVYLTFDDGPSINTGKILGILNRYNVKATFFVIGKPSEAGEKYIKRIYDEGHTLGMHSYSHDYATIYKSVSEFKKDYEKIRNEIERITGEKPKYYRFPGGSSNTASKIDMKKFIKVLEEDDVVYVDWNAQNGDAVNTVLTPEELIDNILNDIEKNNNSIVLMHDLGTKNNTVASLPRLIEKLRDRGYELLPIDENAPIIHHIE